MPPATYLIEADLVDHPGVSRTLAVPGASTLVVLHELLGAAFEWHDDHLYSFWLSGTFWDAPDTEYTSPVEAEPGARTADVQLDNLGLKEGQEIAYLFDFGDQWRVALRVEEIRAEADGIEASVLESRGAAPPQYS